MQLSLSFFPLGQMAILALLFACFCYQLAIFFWMPGERWRCWRLLLLGMLMIYNTVIAFFPNSGVPISLYLQYIFRYGTGLALGACLPLYFYKAHGMVEFLFHLRYGIAACYGLPFLVFFCIVLPSGGDLQWVLTWGLLLPFLYALLLFGVLVSAVYRKFAERDQMYLQPKLDELMLSCLSVAPWIVVTVLIYAELAPWLRLVLMDIGFLVAWVLAMLKDFRQWLVEIRLSNHFGSVQQLTFHDRCLGFGLSKREIEVAGLLCAGLTYREIAEQLYISLHTVDNHVRHIFAKVEVKRKIELLAKLRPEGMG